MEEVVERVEAMREEVERGVCWLTMVRNEEKGEMMRDWGKKGEVRVVYGDEEEVY